MLGLVSLYDPPRPDAKQLIAELQDLGVSVKMLTGDALPVACEIGTGFGLPNIRRVADLKAAGALAGNNAVDLLAGADGFAEVYPEDKYIVVQHLQAAGHVTGIVFEHLAKESGAESFFPTSAEDFKKALDRIAALLNAQYLLAYHPERVDKVRKIRVEVKRQGVKVSARRSVGAESPAEGL